MIIRIADKLTASFVAPREKRGSSVGQFGQYYLAKLRNT